MVCLICDVLLNHRVGVLFEARSEIYRLHQTRVVAYSQFEISYIVGQLG